MSLSNYGIFQTPWQKRVGRNPPSRPWINNDAFDYGRSSYDAGWYLAGKQIEGNHARDILL